MRIFIAIELPDSVKKKIEVAQAPLKKTGAFVSAQAVSAPPAFAVPSILVIITPSIDNAFWNSSYSSGDTQA